MSAMGHKRTLRQYDMLLGTAQHEIAMTKRQTIFRAVGACAAVAAFVPWIWIALLDLAKAVLAGTVEAHVDLCPPARTSRESVADRIYAGRTGFRTCLAGCVSLMLAAFGFARLADGLNGPCKITQVL
jgi:hypothetical protein